MTTKNSKRAAPKGHPLGAALRVRLHQIIRNCSERQVAEAVGCSRQALARALAGLPVYPGTVALVEKYLERMSAK